ncbi:hypothetical protein RRG44_01350 [Mycoplasmopsis cynos]|uniref:hypothetical protein n=1 Tax=Mycoplasmopsis cynos TaxID=171284 RepID=UPI002AFFBDAD|nr:hypothetical protein [Mycoplasmopsis cynos]WQQ19458.1 hypothetical protein RRG44_01350 [Mycoplasmopsis cynos]
MEITIRKLQEYLKNRYKDRNDSVRLLTKLIEEVGEVAEAVNISKGWKPKKRWSFISGGIMRCYSLCCCAGKY